MPSDAPDKGQACAHPTLSVLSLWASDEHPGIFQDYLASLPSLLSLLRIGQSAASLPSVAGILLLSRFMKISEFSGCSFSILEFFF